ncbi:MAG: CHAT domain-containing protein [Betaproteobacteria bacterium]|nr:CHAT domain-containing protein [Betaproteobacteria bacterium]
MRLGLAAALLALAGWTGAARADLGSDQVRYAASGRFDLLETLIEEHAARNPLKTADQHALCYAYSQTKRYARLQTCLDQLEQKIRAGDRRTRLFGLNDATPSLHLMRAEAAIDLAQYPEAIRHAEAASRWLKDDDSDDLDMVCNALTALGIAHAFSGNLAQARKAESDIRALKIGPLSDYANARAICLARVRMALKDYPGVIDAIQGNRAFTVSVFLDRLVSGSFFTGTNNWVWAQLPRAYMLNKALLETGQVEQARQGFDRLLAIPQVAENGGIHWLLLSDRARIAEQAGQLAQALGFLRQAIEAVEGQRASIDTEATKIGFVGDKQSLYAAAVRVAHRLGQPEAAFEFMERGKSRALVDLLAARDGRPVPVARSREAQALLERYQQRQAEAAAQVPLDMGVRGVSRTRGELSAAAGALRSAHADLASLVTVDALSVDELRARLAPNEALLEFYAIGGAYYGLAVSRDQALLAPIDSPRLEQEVREFRILIQERKPEVRALAARLHAALIQPFAAVIGTADLLIVPHGALHYLPFAALGPPDEPLIARRSLRLLPASSVLKYLAPRVERRAPSLLILGNPDVGNSALDLPSAEDEARAIAAAVPGSVLLTREKATETHFKRIAGDFTLLHVASHGQYKADNALDSRLLLAPDAGNDGSLTVREIYGLRLSADLVTLSACETGLGSVLRGDDVLGLARGFLYAGSRNIVASLWEVDDDATAQLMKSFYQRLLAGTSRRQALREAQLALRKDFPDPFFWAAFGLTGAGD